MRFSTGVMHLREGRVDLALEEFKKAVKEDGKNPYFQKGLGLAYSAKRDWKSTAIAAFRRALELNPYYVDVRNDLAAALIGSGDREAGKKEFLTAYSDPTNPTPEVSARNLGQAYSTRRTTPKPINWYRTSLNRNKDYPDAYLGPRRRARRRWAGPTRPSCSSRRRVKQIPNDASLQLALGQALLQRRAASRRRARGSRRSCARTRAGRSAGPPPTRSSRSRSRHAPCPTSGSSKRCWPASPARARRSCSTRRARSWSAPASSTSASA